MKDKPQHPRRETPETSVIEHYLQTWATEAGMDPATLKKYLLKTDYRYRPGEKIPFKAIRFALYGEEDAERLRGMKLVNDERERSNLEACGTLIEWDRVEAQLNQRVFNPLLSALDAAPPGTSAEWVEKVLKPILRQKVPQPQLPSKQ